MGSAGLTISSAIANAGIIKANGGNVTLSGAVSGTGVDSIVGASVIEVAGSDSNTVSFDSASTGTLRLDQSQAFNGTVTGFSKNKTIDLSNVTIGAAHLSYSGNGTSGILTVTDGTTAATIKLTGNYSQANFALANDGAGHTDVTYNGTGLAATHLMVQAMAAMGDGSAGSMTQISGAMNTGAGAANLLALPHAA